MKLIILVAVALVAVAVAAPPELFKILRSDYNVNPEGSYNFDFETENKIVRSEVGEIKELLDEDNKPRPVLISRGFFSYPDAEGKTVRIDYTADENGYHPVGDSIPTVVPSRR